MTLRDAKSTAEALRTYGRLLGLRDADLGDEALIAETAGLIDDLAVAAQRDLGDAGPAPLGPPADRG